MYAVLNKRGDIFIASEILNVNGCQLVFRDECELCTAYGVMNITEAGEIYNPGNGQLIGIWYYDKNNLLHIKFMENNGDLRQLTNNIFPNAEYLRFISPNGAELIKVKWRRPDSKDLRDFKDIIKNYKMPPHHKVSDISNKHRFIKFEGVINNRVVCDTIFDICTQHVIYIDLYNISADSVKDVFAYFGNCKYVGRYVNTLVMTDGKTTNFWNFYKYTEFFDDNESIYVVRTGRGFENVHIFNSDDYEVFYNSYIGRFYMSEYSVEVNEDFTYSVELVDKQTVVRTG